MDSRNVQEQKQSMKSYLITLLGPTGSGKTALRESLAGKPFISQYKPTIGGYRETIKLNNLNHQCRIFDTSGKPSHSSLISSHCKGTGCFIFVIPSEVAEIKDQELWLSGLAPILPILKDEDAIFPPSYILVINKKSQEEPEPEFCVGVQTKFKQRVGIDIGQNDCFVCDPKDSKDEGLKQLKAKLIELASQKDKTQEQKAQRMLELISTFEAVKYHTNLYSFRTESQLALKRVINNLSILDTAKLPEAFQALSDDWSKLAKLDENLAALKWSVQSSSTQTEICEKLEKALGEVILEKLQHLKTNFENYRQHLQEVAEKAKVKPEEWGLSQVESKIKELATPPSIKEALQKWLYVNNCCRLLSEEKDLEPRTNATNAQKINDLVAYLQTPIPPEAPTQTILDFIEERRSGFIKSFLAAIRRFLGLKPEQVKAARHGFFETKVAPVDGAKLIQNVKSLLPKALK